MGAAVFIINLDQTGNLWRF